MAMKRRDFLLRLCWTLSFLLCPWARLEAAPEFSSTESRLAFSNAQLGLEFVTTEKGYGLASLRNRLTHYDFLSHAEPLWRVQLRDQNGKYVFLKPEGGMFSHQLEKISADESCLHLFWSKLAVDGEANALDVEAMVTLKTSSPLSFWKIKVVNRSEKWGIEKVDFPIIKAKGTLGEHAEDDTLVLPHSLGSLIKNPVKSFSGMVCTYPEMQASFQFAALYDQRDGLYFGAYDGDGYVKDLALYYDRDRRDLVCKIVNYPEGMGAPKKDYIMPYPAVVGTFQGDWVTAAKMYRAWAIKQKWCAKGPLFKRTDLSDRIKNVCLWVIRGYQIELDKKEIKYGQSGAVKTDELKAIRGAINAEATAQTMARLKDYFDVPLIGWGNDYQLDTWDGSANGRYVPRRGFREMNAALHRLGIFFHPYTNMHRYGEMLSETLGNDAAKKAAIMNRDGTMACQRADAGANTMVMCAGTDYWQNFWPQKAGDLAREGADSLYTDELGSIRVPFCFDPSHGHPLGGGKYEVEGLRKCLTKLREEVKKIDPQFFTTGECNPEPFLDLNDGNLLALGDVPDQTPVWIAIYHDYAISYGFPFGDYMETGSVQTERNLGELLARAGRYFAWGMQMGAVREDILTFSPQGAGYLKRLVKSYQAAKKFLLYGEWVAFPEIATSLPELNVQLHRGNGAPEKLAKFPAVFTSAWRAPDGAIGLVFVNISDSAQPIEYRVKMKNYGLNQAAWRVSQITPEGKTRLAVYEGDAFTRTEMLAARTPLVLEIEPSSLRELKETPATAPLPQVVPEPLVITVQETLTGRRVGGEGEVVVTIANRTSVPFQDEVKVTAPEAWVVDPPSQKVEVKQDATLRFKVKTPETAGEDSRLTVELPKAGKPFVCPIRLVKVTVKTGCKRASTPIRVDGVLDEKAWASAVPMVLNRNEQMHLQNWGGEADLSGSCYVLWDDQYVYFAARVKDDQWAQNYRGVELWNGDCIQIAFDPLLDGKPSDAFGAYASYGLALTKQGTEVVRWRPEGETRAQLVVNRTDDGFIYEAAIPMDEVLLAKPTLGQPIGFALTLNDADGDQGFKGWAAWGNGICGGTDPRLFGDLTFIP